MIFLWRGSLKNEASSRFILLVWKEGRLDKRTWCAQLGSLITFESNLRLINGRPPFKVKHKKYTLPQTSIFVREMNSKDKDKEKPLATKSKNVNLITSNSKPKEKGKQIMEKSSKRTPKNYAYPIQTLHGIISDMSKSEPLTLT